MFVFTLVPVLKHDFLLETPTLTHETFKALKPGLSAYADDVDKVTVLSRLSLLIKFAFCRFVKVTLFLSDAELSSQSSVSAVPTWDISLHRTVYGGHWHPWEVPPPPHILHATPHTLHMYTHTHHTCIHSHATYTPHHTCTAHTCIYTTHTHHIYPPAGPHAAQKLRCDLKAQTLQT